MKTMNENNFICIKINSWFEYDRVPSTLLFIIDFVQINFFNSWPSSDLIWSDQTKISQAPLSIIDFIQINISIADLSIKWKLRQHLFLPSTHTGQFFQQLTFFWSNENSASILFYHQFIQIKFWLFSAEIILRKQRYMKIFDDFHIEKYFHLFFPSWIEFWILFQFILSMG